MKKTLYGIVFFTSLILTACSQSRNMQSSYQEEPDNSITYQQFYDDLSPYGHWIDNPEFGYVWSPGQAGFRPYYSNGHWVYTNYGWTWASDYNWGWATFHYGRWFYDNFDGWLWVPGYEWAPAWVSWRRSSDFYGWAPLCPRRRNGGYYDVPTDQWAFVPHQYIYRNDINNYYVNQQNNVTIINNTTIINKTRVVDNGAKYQEGPSVTEVEKVAHTKIRTFPVERSSVPGDTKLQNGVFHIYKPAVKQNNINEGGIRPMPSRNGTPINQSQVDNSNSRTALPDNNINRKPIDGKFDHQLNTQNQTPVVKDNPVNSDPNVHSDISNTPVINNNNKTYNQYDERRKQLQNNRQQANEDNQQNPGNLRPNTNDQKTQINQDNNINNEQPKRVPVNPNRSSQVNMDQQRVQQARQERMQQMQQERMQNTQPQTPVNNQRQFKPMPNPAAERPNSFERKFQTAPVNSPNFSRENKKK